MARAILEAKYKNLNQESQDREESQQKIQILNARMDQMGIAESERDQYRQRVWQEVRDGPVAGRCGLPPVVSSHEVILLGLAYWCVRIEVIIHTPSLESHHHVRQRNRSFGRTVVIYSTSNLDANVVRRRGRRFAAFDDKKCREGCFAVKFARRKGGRKLFAENLDTAAPTLLLQVSVPRALADRYPGAKASLHLQQLHECHSTIDD